MYSPFTFAKVSLKKHSLSSSDMLQFFAHNWMETVSIEQSQGVATIYIQFLHYVFCGERLKLTSLIFIVLKYYVDLYRMCNFKSLYFSAE